MVTHGCSRCNAGLAQRRDNYIFGGVDSTSFGLSFSTLKPDSSPVNSNYLLLKIPMTVVMTEKIDAKHHFFYFITDDECERGWDLTH
jgi:hypothetical protein